MASPPPQPTGTASPTALSVRLKPAPRSRSATAVTVSPEDIRGFFRPAACSRALTVSRTPGCAPQKLLTIIPKSYGMRLTAPPISIPKVLPRDYASIKDRADTAAWVSCAATVHFLTNSPFRPVEPIPASPDPAIRHPPLPDRAPTTTPRSESSAPAPRASDNHMPIHFEDTSFLRHLLLLPPLDSP